MSHSFFLVSKRRSVPQKQPNVISLYGAISIYSVLLTPIAANAIAPNIFKELEVSSAAGPSWSTSSNSYVQPTWFETDLNHVDNVTHSTSYQMGIGYHLFAEQLRQRQFLNDFLVQLNFNHNSATINGMVWDASNPAYQNQRFQAPFTSNRLMIDLKPSLYSYLRTSVYAIGGLGIAWNTLSYTETQNNSGLPIIIAPASTAKNLAYDLGFGFKSKINEHLSASLEYVSTHLGHMQSAAYSTGSQALYNAPSFPVRTTCALLGFSWTF